MKPARLFLLLVLVPVITSLLAAERPAPDLSVETDFQVGNLNPVVPPSVAGLFTGNEKFAYLIFPPDQGTCNEGGIQLETVSMLLEFEPAQVPVTFSVRGGLLDAVWDPAMGGFVPGEEICLGLPEIYEIIEPGIYTITVAVPECSCVPWDDYYFLTLEYLDPFEALLPIDDLPEPGIVFNDKGTGWIDMFGMKRTAGGKIIVWGDVICCEPAVGNTTGTWSHVKSLYR
jgi:hypothetical protein